MPANFWTKCPEKPAEAHSHHEQHGPNRSPPPGRFGSPPGVPSQNKNEQHRLVAHLAKLRRVDEPGPGVSAEPRQDGDTLVVPVFEYVPVTELKLMLKEDITPVRADKWVFTAAPIISDPVAIILTPLP